MASFTEAAGPLYRSKSYAFGLNPASTAEEMNNSLSYKRSFLAQRKTPSVAALNSLPAVASSVGHQRSSYKDALESINEKNRNINGNGVCNHYNNDNRNYHQMLHHSTDASSLSSIGSSGSGSLSRASTVLGDMYSSNSNINNSRKLMQGLSSTWSGKPPKSPRPDRATLIFAAIEDGLKECIGLTRSDICMLKASIEDGMSISSAQQYKAAERYLKRLEFQLAKVEELKDQYELHLKMRDGVRSMAYAYVLSPGKERDSALNSVRSGFKECTDTLCAIESEFESIMGTLLLQMKGIQGFARLCPGDVFEVTIKHGDNQKWKTKGRVLKNGNQTWDSQQVLFKALLGDILAIKAVEVRGLGKNITLGNKFCETKDLFSAHPQLMTINLNAIGTLKLNLVVTWNPLHCAGDIGSHKSYHSASSSSLLGIGSSRTLPTILSASPGVSKRRFLGTLPPPRIAEVIGDEYYQRLTETPTKKCSAGATPTSTSTSSGSTGSSLHLTGTSGFGSGSGSGSSSSYCESSSVPNSALTSPDTENAPVLQKNKHLSASTTNICQRRNEKRWKTCDGNEVVVEVTVHQSPASHGSTENCNKAADIESSPKCYHEDFQYSTEYYEGLRRNEGKNGLLSAESTANLYFNINDTLINLMTSLEDIQGQYSELHVLQQQVLELYRVLKQVNKLRCLCFEKSNQNQKARRRRNSTSSDISVSVESALECFDFLNNAITDSDPDSSPEHEKYSRSLINNNANSTSNARFASINRRGLHDRTHLSNGNLSSNSSTPSPIGSPQPLSTGSEQLDIALMSHLTYCQRLLENLGSFGPLRLRELKSLEKLQVQASAINMLEKVCFNLCEFLQKRHETNDENIVVTLEDEYNRKQQKELNILKVDQRIRKLWDTVCYQNSSLNGDEIGSTLIYVTSGQFAQSLETYMKAFLTPTTSSNSSSYIFSKVAKLITSRLIDASKFESDCVVTLFQVAIYFSQENSSLEHLFKSFAEEVMLFDSLKSGDAMEVKQALNKFKKTLPPKEPLFMIALLLLDNDPLIARIAETFFLESNKNKSMRNGLVTHFVEGLEADLPALRQASCMVLMLLAASEVMDKLVYISYADTAPAVREQAKSTLFAFGDMGRKLYEESQLFAHGFQGLSVK